MSFTNDLNTYFKNIWHWTAKLILIIVTFALIYSIVALAIHQPPICSNVTLPITDINYIVNKADVIVYNYLTVHDATDKTTCNINFDDADRFVIFGYNDIGKQIYKVGNSTDLIKCSDMSCTLNESIKKKYDNRRVSIPIGIVVFCILLLIFGGLLFRFILIDYKLCRKRRSCNQETTYLPYFNL